MIEDCYILIFCSHYTLRSVNSYPKFFTQIPWIDFDIPKSRPTERTAQEVSTPRKALRKEATDPGNFWGVPSLKLTWHKALKTRGISEGKEETRIPSIHFQVLNLLLVSGKVILDIPDAIVLSFGGKGSFILSCVKALICRWLLDT